MIKEFLGESYQPAYQPIDSVRHAIQVTIKHYIDGAVASVGNINKQAADDMSLEQAAVLGTSGNCQSASAYVLWTLAKDPRSREQFDRYMVLSAWEQDTPRDRMTLDHAYFLVRDVSGVWYAGTPATYMPEKNPEALIVRTGTLHSIVPNLQKHPVLSRCQWPTAQEISLASEGAQAVIPHGVRISDLTGYITVYEMRSVHAKTHGLHIEKGPQLITYDCNLRQSELNAFRWK